MNKKILSIIIIVLAILIIAGGVFAFIYLGTDTFKSDKQLFFEYISKESNIEEITKNDQLKKYGEKKQTTPYTDSGTLKITNISDGMGVNADAIKNTSITYTGSTDNANKYNYKNVKLNYGEPQQAITVEYINTNDYYGIKIDKVMNKFIAIENNNLKDFARKMGADEETIEMIPDKINFEDDFYKNLFTAEEIETIKANYKSVIVENLTDDMFSKTKTDSGYIYTVTITEDQAEGIAKKILEKLKDDELIMSKVKQVIIKTTNCSESEANEYIQKFKSSIDEMLKDEQTDNSRFGEDTLNSPQSNSENTEKNSNIVINIYVENKKVTKTEIQAEDFRIVCTNVQNGIKIDFFEKEKSEEMGSLTITKSTTSDSVEYNLSATLKDESIDYYEDQTTTTPQIYTINCKISYNGLSSLDQVTENAELSVNMDGKELAYNYTNTKKFESSIIQENITVDDMQLLNTAPNAEAIENYFNRLGESVVQRLQAIGINDDNVEGVTASAMYYAIGLIPVGLTSALPDSEAGSASLPFVLGAGAGLSASMMVGDNAILDKAQSTSEGYNTDYDYDNNSNSMGQQDVATFNSLYENYIGTSKSSTDVRTLIDSIQSRNMQEGKQISIMFNSEQVNDPSTLTISAANTYDVTANYDEEGYINQISITQNSSDSGEMVPSNQVNENF